MALIAFCEIGFWVLLRAGLVARYVFKLRRTSNVLLVGTPVLDVVLLVAAVIDLRGGGEAGLAHGLGATYLGFSVAFGHSLIRWADVRFAGDPAINVGVVSLILNEQIPFSVPMTASRSTRST